MPTDKAELTNEQQAALESLGKKRCLSCQEPLKMFYPAEIVAPPAWFALGIYEKALRGEMPAIIPASGPLAMSEIMFCSTCMGCGNVSLWKLTKTEIDAFYDEAFTSKGYALMDFFGKDWIDKAYKNCNIPKLVKKVHEIAYATRGKAEDDKDGE